MAVVKQKKKTLHGLVKLLVGIDIKSALQEHPTYLDLVTKWPDITHAVGIEPLLT